MSLSGKVVLVTGATGGIGLGIARALAGAGAGVLPNGFGVNSTNTAAAHVPRARRCRHDRPAGLG